MAQPLWEPDGTQPPPPFQAWEDPVSGLVTGSAYESEPIKIDLVQPVMPDLSEVRRAVDAVLSDDGPITPVVPAPRRAPSQTGLTPGLVPPNPRAGWPRTPVRQLAGLRPRTPGGKPNPVTKVKRPAGQRRSQGSSAGFTAIIILILVVVVIIVVAINSLIDTISSIFS